MHSPNNIYVYMQAFSGAVAGLLSQSTPLTTTRGFYTDTIEIAGAWAQEVDTQWASSTNPDLFQYEEILNFSNDLFLVYQPQPATRSTTPGTYTASALALMTMLEDGEAYLSSQGITPPSIATDNAPGTPAYDPVWYALTDVYLDPVSGSDSNSGASSGQALKTMAQVIQRYGSSSPQLPYGQSLTIHLLSSQTANVDAFFFSPRISGGGSYAILASNPIVGAPFSPTSVTARVQTATGNALRLNGSLPGAVAVNQIVHNTTKNSYALVYAVAGGNATVTQPFAAAGLTTITGTPTLVEDNTWASTDTYQLLDQLTLNLRSCEPVGGDSDGSLGTAWFQGVYVPDASGTPGTSALATSPAGCSCIFSLCAIDPDLYLDDTRGANAQLLSSNVYAFLSLIGGATMWGGSVGNFGTVSIEGPLTQFDGDVILDADVVIYATGLFVGAAYITATNGISARGGGSVHLSADIASALLYGQGAIDVSDGSAVYNGTGGTWATCLKMGTLTLQGAATGSSFNAGAAANPYTAGIAITSANIDTGGGAGNPGLQNPRTGRAMHRREPKEKIG